MSMENMRPNGEEEESSQLSLELRMWRWPELTQPEIQIII